MVPGVGCHWLNPQEVRLSEVIQLLEGSITPVECINSPESCPRSDFCITRDVWSEMKKGDRQGFGGDNLAGLGRAAEKERAV